MAHNLLSTAKLVSRFFPGHINLTANGKRRTPWGGFTEPPDSTELVSIVELGLVLVTLLIPGVSEEMRAILLRSIIDRLGFIIDIDTFIENGLNLLCQY